MDTTEGDYVRGTIDFPGLPATLFDQVTPKEVILVESLLTPGLQTSVKCHSSLHNLPVKDLNQFRASNLIMELVKPNLEKWALPTKLNIDQVVYRLSDRKLVNDAVEEFVLHACDQTLLDDAATLVSKMWKCTTPSAVVSEVLSSCAGARSLDVESAQPTRDYMAENIHPFQVVNQQAQAALAGGNDPSFLHYMTYQALGTHHFRSLKSLCEGNVEMVYYYDQAGIAGGGYGNPFGLMTHSFPCDFDLLSDVLNGIGPDGKDINTFVSFNPLMRMANQFGSKTIGCGIGSGNPKIGMSAAGSESQQNMCPDYSAQYVLKRQARMGMLEQDKIALRITVPWVAHLNVGKVIRMELYNKKDGMIRNFGSGDYLIHSLTHNIKLGGFSTLTMDCVSQTVGSGIV
jgi:hypothetical protein